MERLGILRRAFSRNGSVHFVQATKPESLFVFSGGGKVAERIELPRSLEIDAAVRRVQEGLWAPGYTDVSHVIQFFGTRSPAEVKPSEPAKVIPEEKQPTAKPAKPARLSKAEQARARVAEFMRHRLEQAVSASTATE